MQSAKLCKVQTYVKCKTMQSEKQNKSNVCRSVAKSLDALGLIDHRFQDVAATAILLKESRVDVTFLIPGL